MRLRVNGANMHARGANIIPMEEFEGRQTALAYRSMLQVTVAHAPVGWKSASAVNGGNVLHQPFVLTTKSRDDTICVESIGIIFQCFPVQYNIIVSSFVV